MAVPSVSATSRDAGPSQHSPDASIDPSRRRCGPVHTMQQSPDGDGTQVRDGPPAGTNRVVSRPEMLAASNLDSKPHKHAGDVADISPSDLVHDPEKMYNYSRPASDHYLKLRIPPSLACIVSILSDQELPWWTGEFQDLANQVRAA
ncbi:hypothetical protein JX266_011951 [Neoarthrinium moseri]|nr:hypothetical protein JX266_011951 [Neoarthrinium moseri]